MGLEAKMNETFNERYRDKASEILDSYIYSRIHRMLGSAQLALQFPAIDFQRALQMDDNINIEHFGRILQRFSKIKYLTLDKNDSEDWILNHILPTCNTLKIMDTHDLLEFELPELIQFHEDKISILSSEGAHRRGVLKAVCERAAQLKRQTIIYLFFTEGQAIGLSEVLHEAIQKVHIICAAPTVIKVTVKENFIPCPILTHLSITGHGRLRKKVILGISKAIGEEKLPCLQNLSFAGMKIKGRLKNLIDDKSVLTSMTHLNLCDCDLNMDDIHAFSNVSNTDLLSKLTSLNIAGNDSITSVE